MSMTDALGDRMNTRPALTKIELTFWVPLFVDKTVCPVLASLRTNEWSDETLACDFLRKHIFKTVIDQANEVEAEFVRNKTDRNEPAYFMTRLVRQAFSKMIGRVRQHQIGDNLVHMELVMFTPLSHGKPMHHDDELVRWVKNRIIVIMQRVAEQLAEEKPTFGEVYKQFARQMEMIDQGRDPFVAMHLTAY